MFGNAISINNDKVMGVCTALKELLEVKECVKLTFSYDAVNSGDVSPSSSMKNISKKCWPAARSLEPKKIRFG